ncbi:MAG: hypothetical protein V1908_00530 [Candidatus Peregrinibacteria bacterium]
MNLHDSILKTIAFFNLFDFPLTAEEIKDYLYQYDKPVHIAEVKGVLAELVADGKLEAIKDFFVLKDRANLPEIRKSRKFIAEKFWNRVKFHLNMMRHVPFIRLVAVCNNLAYDNVNEQSDIDLFVVTEPKHLWTARFFLTALLHFFGVRRYGDKVAGRFCLSFFVTTEKLDVGELQIKPEDPYLAYWTQTLAPFYGEATYEEFKNANTDWLRERYGLVFSDSAKRHLYDFKPTWLKRFLEIGSKTSLKRRSKRKLWPLMPNSAPRQA